MRRLWILIGLSICFLSVSLKGQDALFSQFLKNKSLLNPSLFAIQNNPLNFQIQYREQGASVSDGLPLRTFLANVNYAGNSLGSDKMSFGLSVLGDKGGRGHISKSMAHLNFSYLKRLSGSYASTGIHYLGIGAQLGGGQHSVQWNRFWFGNQYNREFGFVDSSLDSEESGIESSASGVSSVFYDINAGLNWYSIVDETFSVYAGFGIFHVNRPNISFFENKIDRLGIRNTFHFGLTKILEGGLQIKPKAFYSSHGKSRQIIFGSEIGINNEDVFEVVMDLGVYTRIVNNYDRFGMEALILSLNLGYEQFTFAVSYDITVSQLARYNGSKGAWELMINYAIPEKRKSTFRNNTIFRL